MWQQDALTITIDEVANPLPRRVRGTVTVRPRLHWRGQAYIDSNEGDEPVTEAFDEWDWQRARTADGRTLVVYDVRPRTGGERLIAARFGADGSAEPFEPPPRHALPTTGWRIHRQSRGERPGEVLHTLEDTPFYARSLLRARLLGEDVAAMHETLDVRRFDSAWVQALLPFRMPRRG